MEGLSNTTVDGLGDKGDLELVEDAGPQTKVANCLKSIVSKIITYNNYFPL